MAGTFREPTIFVFFKCKLFCRISYYCSVSGSSRVDCDRLSDSLFNENCRINSCRVSLLRFVTAARYQCYAAQ